MESNFEKDDEEIISSINVTPLVDIVLVLLIIFMVTATYIVSKGLPLELPEAGEGEEVDTTLLVSIDAEGVIYLQGKKVQKEELLRNVKRLFRKQSDLKVVIAADKHVTHGKVIEVMDTLRRAGVVKLAFNITVEKNLPHNNNKAIKSVR